MIYTGTYKARILTRKEGLTFKNYDAVVSADLAYVDVIAVKVEGMTYDVKASGAPSNRVVIADVANGSLLFVRGTTAFGTNRVFVMYQK